MLELQDILTRFSKKYLSSHSVSLPQQKALRAIECCRTAKLDGHMDVCHSCGSYRISYNSCGNRHCPKCGNLQKEQWILDRKAEILPVPYFHTVFTVPHDLNPLFLSNPDFLYSLLLKTASQTLSQLALDKKYLGAQIGLTLVLHTWGQNLSFHPHVHCIVPGGGLSPSGLTFVYSKKKFFIPVKVLSKVFRGKFLSLLKKAFYEKHLDFHGEAKAYASEQQFLTLVDSLYCTPWVVYCKKPFNNTDNMVEYLSRYTHKTAIYNNRLVSMTDSHVSFRWRDYRDGNKVKVMTLDVMEFIRRFLLHVLPSGFQKIRYYGLLSSRSRKTKLVKCFRILKLPMPQKVKLTRRELILKVFGLDISVCSHCGGSWSKYKTLLPATG